MKWTSVLVTACLLLFAGNVAKASFDYSAIELLDPAGGLGLDELLAPTGNDTTYGFQVVDKIFYDFTWTIGDSGPGLSADPTDLTLMPVLDDFIHNPSPGGSPGWLMTGTFELDNSAGGSDVDADVFLTYKVVMAQGYPALIRDIGSHINAGITNPNGVNTTSARVKIDEVAYDLDDVGNTADLHLSLVPDDFSDPPAEVFDDLVFPVTPVFNVLIEKDIAFRAFAGETVTLTGLTQSISQVPEPGFYGVLSLGLAALLLMARRRRKSSTPA
jgi:hypothetical protein